MSGKEKLKNAVLEQRRDGFKVTGIAIQYAAVCKRELWFYLHGVDINRDNTHVVTGSNVDETFYKNAETYILDSMIAPDILEDGRVIEVKPASNKTDGPEMQLSYYLWYFREFYDMNRVGVLAYPTERKREEVILTKERITKVENLIEIVYDMYSTEHPPKFTEKPVCESCAYQDFCQIE